MTDYTRINEKSYQKIIATLPKHTLVIIREYAHPDREFFVAMIADLCRYYRHLFVVANDVKLAIKYKAYGVHLSEWCLGKAAMIKKQHPNWFISAAIHSRRVLARQQYCNAVDALLLSPVFATESHVGVKNIKKQQVIRVSRSSNKPIYALGGVDIDSIKTLKDSQFCGVAAIGMYLTHKSHSDVI